MTQTSSISSGAGQVILDALPSLPVRLSSNFQTILTLRGFLLLFFVVYLLAFPVRTEADIVATVFAWSSLCLLGFVFVACLVQGTVANRGFTLHTSASPLQEGRDGMITAKSPVRFLMRTSVINPLPLFSLQLNPVFEGARITRSLFSIVGRSKQARILSEDIEFPHRGEWRLIEIRASLSDRLGLSSYEWSIKPSAAEELIRVGPAPAYRAAPPIISSSVRSGDAVPDIQRRDGDPFDIRPYQPSDGVRKILWKVFAKSGELLSRHPERSMTPEGQVLVFVSAGLPDDKACSACLDYLELVEEQALVLYAGCEGMHGCAPARSRSQALDLLVESAWAVKDISIDSSIQDLRGFLSAVRAELGNSDIRTVVVFYSQTRLYSATELKRLVEIGQCLESSSIQPVFIADAKLADPDGAGNETKSSKNNLLGGIYWFNSLLRLLISSEPDGDYPPAHCAREFLSICSKRGWQVILE